MKKWKFLWVMKVEVLNDLYDYGLKIYQDNELFKLRWNLGHNFNIRVL